MPSDFVDVPVVRDSRSANSRKQRRLHSLCQKEGARHVPYLGIRQSDIPVRRTAEEVSAGAVREAHEVDPLT